MKKHLKSVISLLLAFVLFATALPLSEISASAAEKLSATSIYDSDGTVIIKLMPGDSDNTIYFTTDGSVPTMDSKKYTMPVGFTEKTIIRAAEYDGDKKVKGIKFTAIPKIVEEISEKPADSSEIVKTGKITFEITQLGDYKAIVEIECETPDCEIRYTTNGSKPDETSELYKNGIIITENTKIRARAYKEGYKTTTTYSKTANVKLFADIPKNNVSEGSTSEQKKIESEELNSEENIKEEKTETVSEPKKDIVVKKDKEENKVTEKVKYKITNKPESGYSYVTFLKQRSTNVIRYTLDGSIVDKNAKKVGSTSKIKVYEPTVLRAKEYTKNGTLVATLKTNIKLKCAPVKFTCIDMAMGTKTIELTSATEGVRIYYTIDSTQPDENSILYTGPISLGDVTNITAVAYKDGYTRSVIRNDIVGAIPYVQKDFDFSDPLYAQVAYELGEMCAVNNVTVPVLNEKLTRAASVRAEELTIRFSHVRPTGYKYSSALFDNGIEPMFAAEFIIAGDATTAKEAIRQIMSDETYYKEMFESGMGYEEVGVGYAKKNGVTYWCILVIRE